MHNFKMKTAMLTLMVICTLGFINPAVAYEPIGFDNRTSCFLSFELVGGGFVGISGGIAFKENLPCGTVIDTIIIDGVAYTLPAPGGCIVIPPTLTSTCLFPIVLCLEVAPSGRVWYVFSF